MRYFDFRVNAENQETVNKILSGCLPHEKFDVKLAKGVLDELFRVIPIEETYGITYVFFKILKNMSVLRMYMNEYADVLRRDVFDAALQAGIADVIIADAFRAKDFFAEYGATYNLDVPSEMMNAQSFVYTEALALYDELFEMQVATSECQTWLSTLRTGIEHDITAKCISIAGQALTQGVPVERELYRGATSARKLMQFMVSDINGRVTAMNADMSNRHMISSIDSFDSSKQFDEKNSLQIRDLYYMGFDPLDTKFCVTTQDIVTIVADEGVGKTRFAVDQAYKAMMAGCNVLYMCGETAQLELKKRMEAQHIFNMYGLQFSSTELQDFSRIHIDDLDKLEEVIVKINSATRDLYENENHGRLQLLQSAFYEDFSDRIREAKDAYDIDIVFIDHVLGLESNGAITPLGRLQTKQARVTYLYQCEDVLVKECNLAFFNTSHPSTNTSADLRSGKKPGARSGAESAESSRYATLIGVLNNNDDLRAQDMVIMYVTKIRATDPITDELVLQRHGYGNRHDYDEAIQHYAQGTKAEFNEKDSLALFADEMLDE
ncbi:MAG: hypothetical protein RSC68_03770 [Acinetobacter sp.]